MVKGINNLQLQKMLILTSLLMMSHLRQCSHSKNKMQNLKKQSPISSQCSAKKIKPQDSSFKLGNKQYLIRIMLKGQNKNTKTPILTLGILFLEIRIPKTNQTQSLLTTEGTLDLSKIKGLSRAHTQLGELKNPVLLNHLSPNRCLVNYQFIELNKASSSYKTVEGVEPIFEAGDINKIQKNLMKLIQILNVSEEWLETQADLY
ncbi:hypothetical protein FGO68_gene3938 [Halteria grandinella]|uniref:Uncharacterized protein n=1 Tax=Halteria grandinella TaxID=5974 RepID=A0A8J8NGN1_HALGN|nr:hypothetical protein FGO68_gene3938 [Halteria grandinella]